MSKGLFVQASRRALVVACLLLLAITMQRGPGVALAQEPEQPEASAPAREQFDLTGNRVINAGDAEAVIQTWLGAQEDRTCTVEGFADRDLNGSGCVDVADVQLVLAAWGAPADPQNPLPGLGDERAPAAVAATFTVNSTGDEADRNRGDGQCRTSNNTCTFRAAIEESNVRAGRDTINFDIRNSGGSCPNRVTINTNTGWAIDDAYGDGIVIDGYSQCGASANTLDVGSNAVFKIELKGTLRTDYHGLTIRTKRNVIRGLSIYNFDNSIMVTSGGWYNQVQGNILGTDIAQTYLRPTNNGRHRDGIRFSHGPSYNVVGCGDFTGANEYVRCATQAEYNAARNVIAGNGQHGVYLDGSYTNNIRVVGNYVGIKADGRTKHRNVSDGFDFNAGAYANWIGGTTPGERNVISGNGSDGIELSHDPNLNRNHIAGNFFGTDATGMISVNNGNSGISLEDGSSGNYIYNNVLSGNSSNGIRLWAKIRHNEIYNNLIGVAADGVTPLANGWDTNVNKGRSGIFGAGGTEYNIIRNNVIANNAEDGIRLSNYTETRYGGFERTQYNTISQNTMYNNGGIGVRLLTSTDPATGQPFTANQGLASPWIERATTAQVVGWSCAGCRVELFTADKTNLNDPSGDNFGEGRTYLGTAVAADNGRFVIPVSGLAVGQLVTTTATDTQGNTSGFGRNAAVVEAPPATPTPTPTRTPTVTPTPSQTPTPLPTPTATATPRPDGSYTARIPIQQWVDDAEEALSNGAISRRDGSLDLADDPYWFGPQAVGLRFQALPVPPGATILSARIDFTASRARTAATSLVIQTEASDNAPVIEWTDFDLTRRSRSSASVAWNSIPAWNAAGEIHASPDLTALVQEVVNRPGWQGGNAVLFLFTGTGQRTATTFDRDPAQAPVLHIEYRSATPPQQGQALTDIPTDEPIFLPLIGR